MTRWLLPFTRAVTARGRLGAIAVSVAVAAVWLGSVSTSNPPGFYRDESNLALNAALIAESGRDQDHALFPLYLRSFNDWKSTPYVYLLAGVFRVVGPSDLAARALSALLGLAAVAMIGLLAFRLTQRASVAIATAVLAAATPWLYEVTRLVFEVSLEPLLLALLLFVLAGVHDAAVWPRRTCAVLGALLALIGYAYAGGRALAPALALALAVFVSRARWRSLLWTWGFFIAALLPMIVFEQRHPGALLARYHSLDTAQDGGLTSTVSSLVGNTLRGLDLVQWVASGDANDRHHVPGTGSLLLAGCLLAIAGAAILVRTRRWTPFWSFVVVGIVMSVVPAAIADIPRHSLRAVGVPVFLTTLSIPTIDYLRARLPLRPWRIVVAAVVAVGAVQLLLFAAYYWHRGPSRLDAFEAGLPGVLDSAAATGRPVVVYRFDTAAFGNAVWYGKLRHIPIQIIGPGHRAPPQTAVVTSHGGRCPSCRTVARAGIFRAYIAH